MNASPGKNDNRKAARVQMEGRPEANVMSIDGTWRRACSLLDVSASGARLELGEVSELLNSQEFFLVLSSTGLAFRRCKLVWINGTTIGVSFVAPATKKFRAAAAR